MKNLCYCIIILLISISTVSAQNSYDIDQRKGKLFFAVGAQYRITPFYQGPSFASSLVAPVNRDMQTSGSVLNLSLDYFITRDFSIGFTNGYRYDMVTNIGANTEGALDFEAAEKTLITSLHFYADYHFKVFKDSELFARVGRSLMNQGTNYIERESFFNNNGEVVGVLLSDSDLGYAAYNFALGYKKNKINVIAGIYTTSNTEFFDENVDFFVPYLEFKYTFGKL